MSAFDPKRTKADAVGLSAMCPNSCRQLGLLDQRSARAMSFTNGCM